MHKHIEIDYKHSRAIVQKIGERLRTSLKPEPGVSGMWLEFGLANSPGSMKLSFQAARSIG